MSHGQAPELYGNLFEHCFVKYGDNDRAPGIRVKCSRCSYQVRQYVNRAIKGPADDRLINRKITEKLEAIGWKIGKNLYHHLCPQCVKDARAKQMRFLHANKFNGVAMGEVVALNGQASQQRPMDRADRRLIFAKLEAVYKDEQTGYQPPWTDQKVADDLGIPLAWVQTVREENFGSIDSNGQLEAIAAAGRNLAQEFVGISEKFVALEKQLAEYKAALAAYKGAPQ